MRRPKEGVFFTIGSRILVSRAMSARFRTKRDRLPPCSQRRAWLACQREMGRLEVCADYSIDGGGSHLRILQYPGVGRNCRSPDGNCVDLCHQHCQLCAYRLWLHLARVATRCCSHFGLLWPRVCAITAQCCGFIARLLLVRLP